MTRTDTDEMCAKFHHCKSVLNWKLIVRLCCTWMDWRVHGEFLAQRLVWTETWELWICLNLEVGLVRTQQVVCVACIRETRPSGFIKMEVLVLVVRPPQHPVSCLFQHKDRGIWTMDYGVGVASLLRSLFLCWRLWLCRNSVREPLFTALLRI